MSAPVGRVEVVYVATPPLDVTVATTLVPSLKVTVPVAVQEYPGVRLAVNVTDCPEVEGFWDEVRTVVVVALLITCPRTADVLVA